MKTPIKRTLSIILAVALIMSIGSVSAFAGTSSKNYLYMGDSMSFNFGQRHAWSDEVKSIYPVQVANTFGYSLDETFAIGGCRTTDMYYLLSDYAGDDYVKSQYSFNEADKANAQESIRQADSVSIMLGYSNLSVHYLADLGKVLDPGAGYDTDLAQIFTAEEIARVLPFSEKALELIKSASGSETLNAIESYWNETVVGESRAKLVEAFGEETVNTIDSIVNAGVALNEALIYLFASELIHFDRTIASIKELNPDCGIYVMGLFNPTPYLKLAFNLGDLSYTLPVGDLATLIFGIFNLYMQVYSPYSDQYYFVENADHLETYGEKMEYDADLTREIIYSVLNGSWYYDEANEANVRYMEYAEQMTPGMMALVRCKTFDAVGIIEGIINDELGSVSFSDPEFLINHIDCLTFDEEGNLGGDEFMRSAIHVYMIAPVLKGIYVHPTQAAHNEMANRLISAMRNPQVDPLAAAYHKLGSPLLTVTQILSGSYDYGTLLAKTQSALGISAQSTADVVSGFIAIAKTVTTKRITSFLSRFFKK